MQLYWQKLSCGCREKENHTAVFSYQNYLTILSSLQIMFFYSRFILTICKWPSADWHSKAVFGTGENLGCSFHQAGLHHAQCASCVGAEADPGRPAQNFLFYKLWPEVDNMVQQTESGPLSSRVGHVTLPSHGLDHKVTNSLRSNTCQLHELHVSRPPRFRKPTALLFPELAEVCV